MVDEIFQYGLQGIQTGLNQAQVNAQAIATSNIEGRPGNLVSNLVDLKKAESQVYSSVAVIKVADKLLGTILDVLA